MTMFYATASYVTPRGSAKRMMIDVEAESLQAAMVKTREAVGRRTKGRASKVDISIVDGPTLTEGLN